MSDRANSRVGRFRTKLELARIMLEHALDAGVPVSWVTADEVYGGIPALHEWLEERQVPTSWRSSAPNYWRHRITTPTCRADQRRVAGR